MQADAGLDLAAKAVYRPIIDETTVLHIGLAAMYTNSEYNADARNRRPKIAGSIPETFSGKAPALISNAILQSAHHYSTYEAELIFIAKKFLFETHYQGVGVDDANDDRYHMGGVLAQCSYLIIGDQQNYNKKTGLTANASPRSLEVLGRYDFLDLHGGGHQHDVTIGLNYFFSKHFNVKLNYGVAQEVIGDNQNTYNIIQARAQFSF